MEPHPLNSGANSLSGRSKAVRRRIGIALAVGLVFYALSDILLWQRIFETNGLYRYDGRYQTGHQAVLVGMIAISVILLYEARFWALWFALAFYTLAFSGLEDVLYYALDGRWIPGRCPWLDGNRLILFKPVTATSLVMSAVVWLVLWTASLSLPAWCPVAARLCGRIADQWQPGSRIRGERSSGAGPEV
jgi:hypothetical protein